MYVKEKNNKKLTVKKKDLHCDIVFWIESAEPTFFCTGSWGWEIIVTMGTSLNY